MAGVFVTRSGRHMPVPTRAKYYSSAARLEREKANHERLHAARAHFGRVGLRLMPQVRMCPERPHQYGALKGQAFTVLLPEAVDVWDLLRDVERFMRSWRPLRSRTPEGQQAAIRLLEAWSQLGDRTR